MRKSLPEVWWQHRAFKLGKIWIQHDGFFFFTFKLSCFMRLYPQVIIQQFRETCIMQQSRFAALTSFIIAGGWGFVLDWQHFFSLTAVDFASVPWMLAVAFPISYLGRCFAQSAFDLRIQILILEFTLLSYRMFLAHGTYDNMHDALHWLTNMTAHKITLEGLGIWLKGQKFRG